MIALRGHHLVCLHFFSGECYDETFAGNLRDILSRAENEDIEITSGADDVCNACPHLSHDRCEHSDDADEYIREMDERACSLLNLSVSDKVRWPALRESAHGILLQWHDLYCSECDWRAACEKNVLFRDMMGKE
jgi:hypothetical protein